MTHSAHIKNKNEHLFNVFFEIIYYALSEFKKKNLQGQLFFKELLTIHFGRKPLLYHLCLLKNDCQPFL